MVIFLAGFAEIVFPGTISAGNLVEIEAQDMG